MTDPVIPDIPPEPVVPPYPALGAPNFNQMAYDVGTSMPGVVSGLNAIALAARECALSARAYAQQVAGSVGDANAAAATATDKAAEAAASAGDAAGSKSAAANSAYSAAASAEAAAGSQAAAAASEGAAATSASAAASCAQQSKTYRDQAEVFATQQLKASSTSDVTPGAGAKAFAIEPSRSFVVGMYLVATSTGAPGTQMSGPVQSYDPATGALVIAVDTFSGAAARADWVIGVAAKGAAGLAVQTVTANTTAVAGVHYVVATTGITLTMPTAPPDGGRIKVTNAAPGNINVNWVGKTVKGQDPQSPMPIPPMGWFEVVGYGGNWA